MPQIFSTSAIILKTIKYGDSSLIINAYTRNFGLVSLMARGVHKNKRKISSSLLQPMNVVEIIFSDNKKSNLYHLKEISLEIPFRDIPNNICKSAILMFLNEILYKTLKEEQPYIELFDFITSSLMALDSQQNQYVNSHLYFLAELTHFLGIAPNFDHDDAIFDLAEGTSSLLQPNHSYYLENDLKNLFHDIFNGSILDEEIISISNQQRNQLLDTLLLYYELHLPDLHEIKSKTVLHEILHN